MSEAPKPDRLLDVVDLRVHFALDQGTVRAVDGVSYHVDNR